MQRTGVPAPVPGGLPGERVVLRAVRDTDLDVLFAVAADQEVWEQRTPLPFHPLDRASWERTLRARLEDPGDRAVFAIAVDGAVVGSCELFDVAALSRSAELGISLAAGARGQGVGTDAMRTLVRFAFDRRNLRRVHLTVLASNVTALACYRRVGFVEEGRWRESAWVRGHYEDEVCLGLLRSEWLAAHEGATPP